MSRNFYSPDRQRLARIAHKCTWCAEEIPKGEAYTHQSGVHDGAFFVTKMHEECWREFNEIGDGEYTPYSNERPKPEV